MLSGTLSNFISQEEFKAFYSQMFPIPMVSIAQELPDIPSICIDNNKGLEDLITHLIEVHKCKKFAFIKGPDDNSDAEARLAVFHKVLKKYNVPVNDDLIIKGDFRPSTGVDAIEYLYNKRHLDFTKLISKGDEITLGTIHSLSKRGILISEEKSRNNHVDAIVCANDNMAIGALQALRVKKVPVPREVIITGFDNQEEAPILTPSLTTVHQPLFEQGYQGAGMLIDIINGKEVPGKVTLPSELLIRESCGCSSFIKSFDEQRKSIEENGSFSVETLKVQFLKRDGDLLNQSGIENPDFIIELLIETYYTSIREQRKNYFVEFVSGVVQEEESVSGEISCWYIILQHIYELLITHIPDKEQKQFAKELLQITLLYIEMMLKRQAQLNRLKMECRIFQVRELGQNIFIPTEKKDLIEIVKSELESFGINHFYLVLYDGTENDLAYGTYLMGFKNNTLIDLPEDKKRFPISNLLPEEVLCDMEKYTILIEPLFIAKEHFGYALFEFSYDENFLYETLRGQISNALKGYSLLQERREAESKLKEVLHDLELSNKKLANLSILDELTGLYNRRGFFQSANSIYQCALNNNKEVVLYFIDLDGLKIINDTHGHKEGDVAIKAAAKILDSSFRDTDIIGRIGGDEFAAMTIGSIDEDMKQIKGRIEDFMSETNKVLNKPYQISFSFGYASCNSSKKQVTLEELLQEADDYLYQEKKRRKKGRDFN